MATDVAEAARRLLAPQAGERASSTHVADRAAQACEQLSRHLSRLVGDNGVATLLKRSLALASPEFPWLAPGASAGASVCAAMRDALEQQELEVATAAFAVVLATFVNLLKRLIGEGLVDRLLGEVWPTIFPQASKETP